MKYFYRIVKIFLIGTYIHNDFSTYEESLDESIKNIAFVKIFFKILHAQINSKLLFNVSMLIPV